MILGTIFEQNSIKVRKNGVLGDFRGTPHPPWGVIEFFSFFFKSCPNMSFQILAILPVSKKIISRYILRSSESLHFPALILVCNYSGLRQESVDFQKTLKYTSKYFF